MTSNARTHLFATLVALVLGLSGCPSDPYVPPLQITQVSYSQTVVLPGETITMSVVADGADDVAFAWSAEAGEFSDAAAATTDWTAPDAEQLVAVTVEASASQGRVVRHVVDIVVGTGIDHDGDGFSLRAGDCDDAEPSVYPGAADVQDGLDNDCDGVVDEGSPDSDDDGDGFSDVDGDCDDGDAAVFPGAAEAVNGADDDCDTRVDEGTDVYDDDGDGYCEAGPCVGGAADGDCNDNSSAVRPGASEILDGVDNDCDNEVDEGTAAFDDDGDGFSELQGDCDDASVDASPVLEETHDDVDNDCDGLVDEDFLVDGDGDGWSVAAGDCDDGNAYVYPGAPEWFDSADNDCNGSIDDSMDTSDDDGDGASEADGDCDDFADWIGPSAAEVLDTPVDLDNDCDGYVFANPPVAVASSPTTNFSTATPIDLDGSASSDPDGEALTFYWYFASQPIQSALESSDITDGGAAAASFTPDVSGAWVVALLVSDGQFNSEPATLHFTVP